MPPLGADLGKESRGTCKDVEATELRRSVASRAENLEIKTV